MRCNSVAKGVHLHPSSGIVVFMVFVVVVVVVVVAVAAAVFARSGCSILSFCQELLALVGCHFDVGSVFFFSSCYCYDMSWKTMERM